jgi:hypothetical protein
MLCNLPIQSGRIWADYRIKAAAFAVDITTSHRGDPVRLVATYALQAAKLARHVAEYIPARPPDRARVQHRPSCAGARAPGATGLGITYD